MVAGIMDVNAYVKPETLRAEIKDCTASITEKYKMATVENLPHRQLILELYENLERTKRTQCELVELSPQQLKILDEYFQAAEELMGKYHIERFRTRSVFRLTGD